MDIPEERVSKCEFKLIDIMEGEAQKGEKKMSKDCNDQWNTLIHMQFQSQIEKKENETEEIY